MLKKLFVTAAAAAAVSVPVIGVAGADPSSDNPGVRGNIPGPTPGQSPSPGSLIKGGCTGAGLQLPGPCWPSWADHQDFHAWALAPDADGGKADGAADADWWWRPRPWSDSDADADSDAELDGPAASATGADGGAFGATENPMTVTQERRRPRRPA